MKTEKKDLKKSMIKLSTLLGGFSFIQVKKAQAGWGGVGEPDNAGIGDCGCDGGNDTGAGGTTGGFTSTQERDKALSMGIDNPNQFDCGNHNQNQSSLATIETSTPFIAVYKNGKEEILNDVMIGYPRTFDGHISVAKTRYESGDMGTDTYIVPLESVDRKDNRLTFTIHELEEEVSVIDALTVKVISGVPATATIVATDYLHQTVHAYVPAGETVINRIDEQGASKRVLQKTPIRTPRNTSYEFILKNSAVLDDTGKPVVLLSSSFRSWSLGKRLATEAIKSPYFALRKVGAYMVAVFVGIIGYTGMFGFGSLQKQTPTHSNTVYADTPHNSLLVSYFNWKKGTFDYFGVVQPRALRPEWVSIALPIEARNTDGEVRLHITATEDHQIDDMMLISSAQQHDVHNEPCPLVHANKHGRTGSVEDVTQSLSIKSEDRVTLTPGDKIVCTINLPQADLSHVAFTLSGYYAPLTYAEKVQYAGWHDTLEPHRKEVAGRFIRTQ